MVLILYGSETSPPVRGVRLACKAMGIEYELKKVNVVAGDLLKPEFLKLNPLHTVPTIVDGDFVLWDSHAIVTYLGDKAGNDTWYPKDIKKRAIVQQRLQFNNGLIFTRFRDIVEPIFYKGATEIPEEKKQRMQDALGMLELLIQEEGWLAGSHATVADCCVSANVATIVALFPDWVLPPKVAAWLRRCEEELPGFDEINTTFVKIIATNFAAKLKK